MVKKRVVLLMTEVGAGRVIDLYLLVVYVRADRPEGLREEPWRYLQELHRSALQLPGGVSASSEP